MFKNVAKVFKNFAGNEKGDAVVWLVLIIIGILLAVVIWNNLGAGVKSAAESMKDALMGK